MSRIKLNLIGFVYGLFIINSVAFGVYYFLKTNQVYGVLLTAGLGSFFGFVLMLYGPIPLLKKLVGLGLALSFLGGFLIGTFKVSNDSFSLTCETVAKAKSISINAIDKYPNEKFLKFNDLFVYYSKEGVYNYRNRNVQQIYFVYPLKSKGGFLDDTLKTFACFYLQDALAALEYKDYINYLQAPDNAGEREEYDVFKEHYKTAAETVAKREGLPLAKNPVFLTFMDYNAESKRLKQNYDFLFYGVNGIWLFFSLMVIIRNKPAKDKK